MNRHWVIGDVHGCLDALEVLLSVLPDQDHLVFCGDVVGRGPDVQQTAEQVWTLRQDGRATWLLGNHEQRLIDSPDLQQRLWPQAPEIAQTWVHRLGSLPLLFEGNGWVATHAGFDQHGQPDLEIREPFWNGYDGRFGRVVVAHTPGVDVREHGEIVLIDTGAVYGGRLTAFCPETSAVVQVQGLEPDERANNTERSIDASIGESPASPIPVAPC